MSTFTKEQRKDGLCYQYSQNEIAEINALISAGYNLNDAVDLMRACRPQLDGHFLNSDGEVIK